MLLLWIVGYISLASYPGAIPGVPTFVLSRCTVVLFAVLSHPDKPSVTFEEQPKSDAVVPYKPVGRAIALPNAAAAKKYSMNATELRASVAA